MNYSKGIILTTILILIITIVCAINFSNESEQETQTSSSVENFISNKSEENIERIVVVLPSSKKAEENSTNNVDTNISGTNDNTNISTNNTVAENTSNYYIKVNYTANVVNVYTKDNNGNYTVPYKAMICSTGTSTPTSGVYPIKLKWKWLPLFGDVYGYYTTQIVGNILFHSVPYLEKGNPSSLEYWEYDKLGTSASMGCIRLKVEDAMWIYYNCPSGTMVEFYSSSNPGPLGKPTAPKISGYDSPYRNWDPTDPDSSNPWKTNPPLSNEQANTTKPENEIETNTTDNNLENTNIPENNLSNNTISNNTTENLIDNSITSNTISNNIIEKINNITEEIPD